jgi:hypothetical protein
MSASGGHLKDEVRTPFPTANGSLTDLSGFQNPSGRRWIYSWIDREVAAF